MTAPTYIHIFSNGCRDKYPSNTLTKFTNSLPLPLEVDSRYEIGVSEFGFSSRFKNVRIPDKPSIPSIIIIKCDFLDAQDIEFGPYSFQFHADKLICVEDGESDECKNSNCMYWPYYLSNKEYSEIDFDILFEQILEDTGVTVSATEDGKLFFEISDSFKNIHEITPDHKYCWVMMHSTFMETFNFDFSSKKVQRRQRNEYSYEINIGGKKKMLRETEFKGDKYSAYFISRHQLVNNTLISDKVDLSKKKYPKYIKIVSDVIRPQILNNSYSQELVVFSPDFTIDRNYTIRSIKNIDFIPLLNSTITSIDIKLLDENNDQLQILDGIASFVKLVIKKMPFGKESFNVRLTSEATENYPENTNFNFKMKLPSTLEFNSSWKVSLNSISHPCKWSTFLEDESTRKIVFIDRAGAIGDVGAKYVHLFKGNYIYNEEELIKELNNAFLSGYGIGEANYTSKRCDMKIVAQGTLILSNYLARILGYKPAGEEDVKFDTAKYAKIVGEQSYKSPSIKFKMQEGNSENAKMAISFVPDTTKPSELSPHYQTLYMPRVGVSQSIMELIDDINKFFLQNNIGNCKIIPGRKIQFNILARGDLVFGNLIASVLGFTNNETTLGRDFAPSPRFFSVKDEGSHSNIFHLIGEEDINIHLLMPEYMMIYSNIIQAHIVGGEYKKMLRLADMKQTNLNYTMTEFENKEFYNLETHNIDVIEVSLCAHDGQFINFATSQDVILNLEFSNYDHFNHSLL